MDIEQVREFTLSLYGVTEDQPFGDDNITFRVEGKIFLCLWLGNEEHSAIDGMHKFACKLSPDRNEELRDRYEAVTPAFQIETEVVMAWIRESYQLIVSKLPKAARAKYQM